MKLENLTDNESNNMNIIGFVIALLVVLMFAVLGFYKFFMNTTKNLNNIINILAVLYLGLIIAASILYFVYRKDKTDENAKNDSIVKPLITIVIGIAITASVLFLKNKILSGTYTIVFNKYLSADSTTTVVGEESSPMKLTNTN